MSITIHSIVIDPGKIVSRFNYRFRYSSSDAFADADINDDLPSR